MFMAVNMERGITIRQNKQRVRYNGRTRTYTRSTKLIKKNIKHIQQRCKHLDTKDKKEYFDGNLTKEEEAIEKNKTKTRRYTKRQLTWFRKNKETIWLDGTNDKSEKKYKSNYETHVK